MTRRISYEEHQKMGPKLNTIQNELRELAISISNQTGSSKRVTHLAFRAYHAVQLLQSALDTELNRLISDDDPRVRGILHVYYPLKSGERSY